MSLDITPLVKDQRLMIQSYGDGHFNVNEHRVKGSVLLNDGVVSPWEVTQADEITYESLEPLLKNAAHFDILIVGCGEKARMPSKELKDKIKEAGLILEWMNSGAAARTFNVLQIEDRRVLAAIIAV